MVLKVNFFTDKTEKPQWKLETTSNRLQRAITFVGFENAFEYQ